MRALARRFEALNSLTPSPDHSRCNAMSRESMVFWVHLTDFDCQSSLVQATLEKPGSCCFNPLQKDESTLTQACLWLCDSIGFKWKKAEEMVCFSCTLASSIKYQTRLRNSRLSRWTACPAIALDFVHTMNSLASFVMKCVPKFHERMQIETVLSCVSVVVCGILSCQVINRYIVLMTSLTTWPLRCEATTPNVTTSSGIKGLPLVAGGKYQYEAT